MRNSTNIYRAARMKAAQREPIFSSRERAAAMLYVSCEALRDYETGQTATPCDVAQRMIEEYAAPELRKEHIRACCPLLPDYGGEAGAELTRAALSWAVEFAGIHDTALRFARMARDGEITADELSAAQAIRTKAVALRQIMEDTIAAIDKAMREAARPTSFEDSRGADTAEAYPARSARRADKGEAGQ
ncbi:MAG: hypothetical protein IJ048_06260 [Clostridia bacterium]|nr:hypothetical protein [Clostridia bacterium]